MSPVLVALIVVGFIALLVVQQIVFDRGLRKQRENRTGLFQYSRRTRGVILGIVAAVFVVLTVWQFQLQP